MTNYGVCGANTGWRRRSRVRETTGISRHARFQCGLYVRSPNNLIPAIETNRHPYLPTDNDRGKFWTLSLEAVLSCTCRDGPWIFWFLTIVAGLISPYCY